MLFLDPVHSAWLPFLFSHLCRTVMSNIHLLVTASFISKSYVASCDRLDILDSAMLHFLQDERPQVWELSLAASLLQYIFQMTWDEELKKVEDFFFITERKQQWSLPLLKLFESIYVLAYNLLE